MSIFKIVTRRLARALPVPRIFAIYMILLYMWVFYCEWTILRDAFRFIRYYYERCPDASVLGIPFKLLVYMPYSICMLALILLILLAIKPGLMHSRRYVLLLGYALASWVTAYITPGSLFERFRLGFIVLYTFIIYPAIYIVYIILIERFMGSLMGNLDLRNVSPRLYKSVTIAMALLGPPLLIIGLMGWIFRNAVATVFLYPGIGAVIIAYHSKYRRRPYRFLLLAPLIGQAMPLMASTVDWAPLWPFTQWLLPRLFHIGRIGPEQSIGPNTPAKCYYVHARYPLFPIPGYGGFTAIIALAGYTTGPISLSSILIFLEWLMFYKALKKSMAPHEADA